MAKESDSKVLKLCNLSHWFTSPVSPSFSRNFLETHPRKVYSHHQKFIYQIYSLYVHTLRYSNCATFAIVIFSLRCFFYITASPPSKCEQSEGLPLNPTRAALQRPTFTLFASLCRNIAGFSGSQGLVHFLVLEVVWKRRTSCAIISSM